MSVRLYVGNLPEDLSRQELEAAFAEAGDSISTKIITDRKTNKCRGFGFVTVKTDEEADAFIEKFNGSIVKENPIKIEKALPRAKDKGGDEQPAAEATTNSGSGRRKGGNSKSSRRSNAASTPELESVQPDPRWAQELEKLKQLLAAQTTNS
ncbi:RRM domain-containing RNA-binding protein [Leptolyngbyaceae cyanobacterium JSC-12]|nr:RRM domain-containing RNA-binding protein [Leptolyngbyaceae cyanobacterium JSC-12]